MRELERLNDQWSGRTYIKLQQPGLWFYSFLHGVWEIEGKERKYREEGKKEMPKRTKKEKWENATRYYVEDIFT